MSDGRVRLTAKLRWRAAYELLSRLLLVWHSLQARLWITVLLQRVNICQTRSPQCFGFGINEQILFEVGMRSEIEWAVKQMILKIQMWIAFISSSSCSAAVIAEAIEVDNKPYKFIFLLKLKYSRCGFINKNFIAHLVYCSY